MYSIFQNHLIDFDYCLNKILHYMYEVNPYYALLIGIFYEREHFPTV
jgi:hypothetical protein